MVPGHYWVLCLLSAGEKCEKLRARKKKNNKNKKKKRRETRKICVYKGRGLMRENVALWRGRRAGAPLRTPVCRRD